MGARGSICSANSIRNIRMHIHNRYVSVCYNSTSISGGRALVVTSSGSSGTTTAAAALPLPPHHAFAAVAYSSSSSSSSRSTRLVGLVPIPHPWGWTTTTTGGAARAHAITTSAAAAASSAPESSSSSSGSDAAQPLAFEFQVGRSDVQGGGSGAGKVRLDAYLAARLPDASRAKIAASVKAGLIAVNGARMSKPSGAVRAGDVVAGALLPPEPCTAVPDAIPLDVVYEDGSVIVVNKAPGMVVHVSPGHTRGTLVNALLAHCGLPAMDVPSGSTRAGGGGLLGSDGGGGDSDSLEVEEEEEDDDETIAAAAAAAALPPPPPGVLRPGIVHRLDKGTSGLLVVAKDDLAHTRLCEQFKARTVSRIYRSLAFNAPAPPAGRVATNIGRDARDRLRMEATGYGGARGRPAASNYRTLRVLGGSGGGGDASSSNGTTGVASLVEWRLETGRTHQIRVHARHINCPLLGDDAYGPGNAATARTLAGRRASLAPPLRAALDALGRPALHAMTLGFDHPKTGERLSFEVPPPPDFVAAEEALDSLLRR